MIVQHLNICVKGFIEEYHFWVQPYLSSSAPHVMSVLFGWFKKIDILNLNNLKLKEYTFFNHKQTSEAMGNSIVDVKYCWWTQSRDNSTLHLMLSRKNPLVNGQDLVVLSGYYWYLLLRVAFIDEVKNTHRKITMTHINTLRKGVNAIILTPAMGKLHYRLGDVFFLTIASGLGEGKLWIQTF